MKRPLVIAFLVGLLIVSGCSKTNNISSSSISPATYNSQKINRNGRELWSILPADLDLMGLKQGDTVAKAIEILGNPSHVSDNIYQWFLPNGGKATLSAKGDQVNNLAVTGSVLSWKTRRGIHVGSTFEDITNVYGPSHDVPSNAVFESSPGGSSISFMLEGGKVTGFLIGY